MSKFELTGGSDGEDKRKRFWSCMYVYNCIFKAFFKKIGTPLISVVFICQKPSVR